MSWSVKGAGCRGSSERVAGCHGNRKGELAVVVYPERVAGSCCGKSGRGEQVVTVTYRGGACLLCGCWGPPARERRHTSTVRRRGGTGWAGRPRPRRTGGRTDQRPGASGRTTGSRRWGLPSHCLCGAHTPSAPAL